MPLNFRSIQNYNELLLELKQVDISVPGRINGRKTDHTETYTICRLLATLAETDCLTYPLSVSHQDRPDILIQLENSMIGVEITEAISQQYAEYCALAEREFPDVFLEPAHFRWGSPKLTVKQMRKLLRQSQLNSGGWEGNRPEQEWAEFILSAIQMKLQKLAHPDFTKFEKNWLSIYDNLPLPHINLEKALTFLRPLIQNCWYCSPGFDKFFIEHGPVIAQITERSSEHLVLKDLWE